MQNKTWRLCNDEPRQWGNLYHSQANRKTSEASALKSETRISLPSTFHGSHFDILTQEW
jgi:hypothetical protein